MPVLELEGDAVQVRDAGCLAAVTLLELLELQGHIGDSQVDLPRDEVALTERRQQLRQPSAAARDELQQHQRRHDAGVAPVEVLEVVVPGHLAREHGVLLADAGLDERVADPVFERPSAGGRHCVANRP